MRIIMKKILALLEEKGIELLPRGIENHHVTITYFDDKQPSCVKFINDEKYKYISWHKDNTINYQQCDDGYSVLQKTYDNNEKLSHAEYIQKCVVHTFANKLYVSKIK